MEGGSRGARRGEVLAPVETAAVPALRRGQGDVVRGAEARREDVRRAHVVAKPIRAFRAHHLVVRVYSDQYVALIQHLQRNR